MWGENMQFLSTIYGKISAFAGAVALFWGLFKGLGALFAWIDKKITEIAKKKAFKKELEQLPQKTYDLVSKLSERIDIVENQISSINVDIADIKANSETNNLRYDDITREISTLSNRLHLNGEATASVMLQKMMWAYHEVVDNKKVFPVDVRVALTVMYDEYKRCEWHNHVPEDFKERIMECDKNAKQQN